MEKMPKTGFNRVYYNNINNYSGHLSIPFENISNKIEIPGHRLAAEIVHQFLNCVKALSLKK